MYKCLKCNKEFKFESEYKRYQDKKISCDKLKDEHKCIICNVNFNWPAEQRRHEKTEKHIKNYNKIKNIKEKGQY